MGHTSAEAPPAILEGTHARKRQPLSMPTCAVRTLRRATRSACASKYTYISGINGSRYSPSINCVNVRRDAYNRRGVKKKRSKSQKKLPQEAKERLKEERNLSAGKKGG